MQAIDSPATEVGTPASLLARARTGDHGSFDRIIDLYQGPVYSYVRYLIGQPEAAHDLTQDVFLAAYLQVHKAPDDLRIDLWLYRLATRRFLNTVHWRRTVRRPWERLGSVLRNCSKLRSNREPDHVGTVGMDEVDRLLVSIPPRCRAALVLRECQGLNYDEISAVLDVTRGEVIALLFQARQEMNDTPAAA